MINSKDSNFPLCKTLFKFDSNKGEEFGIGSVNVPLKKKKKKTCSIGI